MKKNKPPRHLRGHSSLAGGEFCYIIRRSHPNRKTNIFSKFPALLGALCRSVVKNIILQIYFSLNSPIQRVFFAGYLKNKDKLAFREARRVRKENMNDRSFC